MRETERSQYILKSMSRRNHPSSLAGQSRENAAFGSSRFTRCLKLGSTISAFTTRLYQSSTSLDEFRAFLLFPEVELLPQLRLQAQEDNTAIISSAFDFHCTDRKRFHSKQTPSTKEGVLYTCLLITWSCNVNFISIFHSISILYSLCINILHLKEKKKGIWTKTYFQLSASLWAISLFFVEMFNGRDVEK